jgi:site-specific DNA-methyltransferase (adenine-specific)
VNKFTNIKNKSKKINFFGNFYPLFSALHSMRKKILNAAMFESRREDWETPQNLFDELNREFGFTLDPCATHETAKCAKYFTPEDDGLSQDWTGEVVYCNPPYGRAQNAWVQKCREHGANGGIAVMLIPARTDTARFHDLILGKAEIRFIRGRLKFEGARDSAPFPSMIVIFRNNHKPTRRNE